MLTKKIKMGVSALALSLVAVLATSARAESTMQSETAQSQVADQLAQFKRTAYELSREADTLSSRANSRLTWQTHSHRLRNLTDHVNQLGRALTDLEALKPQASEAQQIAIEHARPHLVSVARSTTRAIEILNHNRASVRFPEYGEALSDLYDHAERLRVKLDAVLDYENARMRMDALELQTSQSEGS